MPQYHQCVNTKVLLPGKREKETGGNIILIRIFTIFTFSFR